MIRAMKKPLEPLIPLDEFGKLVAKIAQVPKEAVSVRGSSRPIFAAPKAAVDEAERARQKRTSPRRKPL